MKHSFPESRHYIAGEWHASESGKSFPSINPATGEPFIQAALGGEGDIDRAVTAARDALDGPWKSFAPTDRRNLLNQVAAEMKKRKEALALCDTSHMGKPITDSRGNVDAAIEIFEYYAGLADKVFGTVTPVPGDNFNYILREPVGVVAAITPWNFPVWMVAMKLGPALACGNTVVLKPAEQSPGSALEMAAIFDAIGIPPGVVNVVTGDGPNTGAPLTSHPGVDHISFTGSSEVGRVIAEAGGRNLVPVTCELGGKTPNVVFADADLDQAVSMAISSICMNQGQICVAGSRLVVQDSIREKFVDRFVDRVEALKVGNPLDESMHMGSLVDRMQFDRVMGYVEKGRAEGTLRTGGGPINDPDREPGFYMRPTVFDNVSPDAVIAQDEVFGPVLSVIPFKDDDEAIRLANHTRYGLAAWLFTGDLRRAHRFAREIEAGIVAINRIGGFYPLTPYAGYKSSGVGAESGMLGAIESYTRIKSVTINLAYDQDDWSSPR